MISESRFNDKAPPKLKIGQLAVLYILAGKCA
jgi:hypothetical protein